jgi:hypothetical protein
MRFQTPLVPARLIRRYKRFLADARLEDGREIIAHCANPGSMMGLADEGMKIWLEPNDDPRCLIPRFDGAILSQEWKEALWDKFVMGAPRPRTSSELQYSDRKLRSRS